MDSFLCIHSSNRLESLLELFKQNFTSRSNPFTKRLIVVPSPIMRSWLLKEFARDPKLSVACGLELAYMNQAFGSLLKLFDSSDREMGVFPTQMEMALAIESEIQLLLSEESELWSPLLLYLQTSAGPKGAKRLTRLSDELAKYFLQYGIYAGKMLENWRNEPPKEWQQALYLRIMDRHPEWKEPYKEFHRLMSLPSQKQDLQVHLFGLNFLSRIHHDFLKKVSETHPVNYYLLSPSEMFWSDIASDSELCAMRKHWNKQGLAPEKQEELEYYLIDRNQLLANLSRLGRKMLMQIEDDKALEEAHYQDSNDHTLLSSLQSDMLELKNHKEKIAIKAGDSIQVQAAPSRYREVQIVFQTILNLIDKKHFEPSDFIVMAPDIRFFAPYIKTVFDDPNLSIDTQIYDLEMNSQNTLVQSFMSLLSIADSRFEAKALLQFFETKEVMKQHKISKENLHLLKCWIKDVNIRWGENIFHKNELLKRDCCRKDLPPDGDKGTWEKGIKSLLLGLMMNVNDNDEIDMDCHPYQDISLTELDFLGKVLLLLGSLRGDLKPLTENDCLTLNEWSSYLRCLYEGYFAIDRMDDEACSAEVELYHMFDRFGKAGAHFEGKKYSWQCIKHHLNKIFQESTMNAGEHHLQAVKFCSMLPMRAIPAKVIILMGMEEEAFPKCDEPSPLDLSRNFLGVDYCPTSVDFDRTLFLESILSARDSLIITYTDEKGETSPSLLALELMDYLDDNYVIEGKKPSEACFIKHPFDSFDPRYFQAAKSPFTSYSERDYESCLSILNQKNLKTPFIPEFFSPDDTSSEIMDKGESRIKLSDLFSFAKNPLKTYFQKSLGIYLKDEQLIPDEDQFDLSPLEKYQIKMNSLENPYEKSLLKAEKRGTLPQGLLKDTSCTKLQEDVFAIKDFLKLNGINEDSFLTVELCEDIDEISSENLKKWKIPSIKCSEAILFGKMDELSKEGLIINASDSMADLIASWPKIVLLNCISELMKEKIPIKKQLFLLKKEKMLPVNVENPFLWLNRYVDYYLHSRMNVSPMLPEWVELLLMGKDLDKCIDDSLTNQFKQSYNKYLLLSMRGKQKMNSEFIEKWKQKAFEGINLKHEIFGKHEKI